MAVSMMLKSREGSIVGYVLLLENRLHYRINGDGESGTLVLLANQGAIMEVETRCDSHERQTEYKYIGKEFTSAYAVSDGHLLAFTDPAAMNAFEAREERRIEPRQSFSGEKTSGLCKKDDLQCVYKEEKTRGHAHTRHGDVRWPPPPCWPEARYVSGVWIEAGED